MSRYPFETLDTVVMSPHRAGHGPHVERERAKALEQVLDALDHDEQPRGRIDVKRGY